MPIDWIFSMLPFTMIPGCSRIILYSKEMAEKKLLRHLKFRGNEDV